MSNELIQKQAINRYVKTDNASNRVERKRPMCTLYHLTIYKANRKHRSDYLKIINMTESCISIIFIKSLFCALSHFTSC